MAAVALREDRLDLISLAPVLAAKVPVQRFLLIGIAQTDNH